MHKNMRIMRIHEAFQAYGGKYLFCSGFGPYPASWDFAKQIFTRAFWHFCLILPHNPHDLRIVTLGWGENMRIMRIHEDGFINGFYLPCIEMGSWSRPKHEADMRQHEAHPHVLDPLRPSGTSPKWEIVNLGEGLGG